MRQHRGFTLIELMIVVAIIGILSAIAVPAYRDYVMRAKITEATSNLSAFRNKMEQYFQDHRSYNNVAQPPCGAAGSSVAPLPPAAEMKYFTLSCTDLTGASYTVIATGTGNMSDFRYSVNQANTRTTLALPATTWTLSAAGATCWILKPDGTC